jgi:dynein heavy chain
MEDAWESLAFGTKEWRTSHILVGIDEIQQELDDQIVRTQAMRGSRFVKPFLKRTTTWECTLVELQEIIDNWLKVQASWLYLEPIFSSDDIMKQIPTEGRLFKSVNQVWMDSMAITAAQPAVLQVARREGLLDSLRAANTRLDRIQKGLNDYLETKRLAFPRFFFLSNDELLEILAETKDPTRVQPHLKKCFDGVATLEFTDRLDILACYDGPADRSERLEFSYGPCHHRPINPRDSGGNVEKWLVEVESIMKKSLAYAMDQSLIDHTGTERAEWLRKWQGQTVLTVNQITWVAAVEAAIIQGGPSMQTLFEIRREELLDVVKSVRGNITKMLRKTLGSLVVMDVHNRDITAELAGAHITGVLDFDWQAHLRYYHRADSTSAQSGDPGSIACHMINAMILYAYEYIGNCGRLVITPLTDRCYRTLMGAIHLNLGGAPEGPAGTGKTETTKDLGKAIAIQCVVTNCSDGAGQRGPPLLDKVFVFRANRSWGLSSRTNR